MMGPIPVVVEPYFKIFAHMDFLPISVYAGIRCQYRERIEIGYRYCNKGCKSGPIRSRKTLTKKCTKKFGVGDEEMNKLDECPVQELGFDLKLNVQVFW